MIPTTLDDEALARHGPIMGTPEQQRLHALRLEVQRLHDELRAERRKTAVLQCRAAAVLRELADD